MMTLKIIQSVSQSIDTLKGLVITMIFQHENIQLSTTFDNSFAPLLNYNGVNPRIQFDDKCSKQDKVILTLKNIVNIYIVHKINIWAYKQNNNFMLANPLLGAVKLTENTDFGKYKYSEYGIRFDKTGSFSFSDISGFTKIIIIPVVI